MATGYIIRTTDYEWHRYQYEKYLEANSEKIRIEQSITDQIERYPFRPDLMEYRKRNGSN